MRLNQKGYMLVEIILSSVLAMTIAYYLLNLTYQFKNTNEDIYQSITYENDKIAITKNIMNDLDTGIVKEIDAENIYNKNDIVIDFKLKLKKDSVEDSIEERRRIEIKTDSSGTTFYYGKRNASNTSYDTSHISYYVKKMQSSLKIDVNHIEINSNSNYLTITIPVFSIYEDENYDIKLFVNSEGVK